MAIEVFNRQELKFVITKAQYMSMLPEITRHMRLDIHNNQGQAYRLYNLYIDTEDRALIRHSTTKPVVYKEKLRLRSYRPFHEGEVVFFEVKKRYKRITNKRRTKMLYEDAIRFIATPTQCPQHSYMNKQVVDELGVILQREVYRPQAYISYDRVAYHDKDKTSDLRVTFDKNIISQPYGGTEKFDLLGDNQLIMEVKSTANMPLWLSHMLNEHAIYKQSFSKYGREHMRDVARHINKEVHYA